MGFKFKLFIDDKKIGTHKAKNFAGVKKLIDEMEEKFK